MSEPLTRLLAELPPVGPDPMQAEQIRMRCRARLVRQAARGAVSPGPGSPGWTAHIWRSLAAALGVAYLTEVIIQALRLYRFP